MSKPKPTKGTKPSKKIGEPKSQVKSRPYAELQQKFGAIPNTISKFISKKGLLGKAKVAFQELIII